MYAKLRKHLRRLVSSRADVKECQNMINREYSKHYYVQHRERLKEFGIKNYHAKAGDKKKVGRPRNPEYYPEN